MSNTNAPGPRLRPDDLGQLRGHCVLNELTAQLQTAGLRYWRDKQGHEVDLI
jgi:predicted AAA+ superfamily ATPase